MRIADDNETILNERSDMGPGVNQSFISPLETRDGPIQKSRNKKLVMTDSKATIIKPDMIIQQDGSQVSKSMKYFHKIQAENRKLFEQARQIDLQVELFKHRSKSEKVEKADLTIDDLVVSKHR